MTIVVTIIAIGLIFLALHDIFQQLFNPTGGGSLSRMLMHLLWDIFRWLSRYYQGLLAFAGPTILVAIIGTWSALLILGWALIYWPRMPDQFLYAPGLQPANNAGFLEAIYLSVMTLTTLGYGTITPTTAWLRIIGPLEALIGFTLLTVSLTWVTSIYPVLRRRRSLARQILLLCRRDERESGDENAIGVMNSAAAERVLGDLSSQLISVETDLVQFPITYYFHDTIEKFSLPYAIVHLLQLAQKYDEGAYPLEVQLCARELLEVIEDLSTTLASRAFLGMAGRETKEVLEGYARDHLQAHH